MTEPLLPVKTRELQSNHFDSTKWNKLSIRDDDIIVTTAYKSGTTWTQNIIIQLLYQGKQIPENSHEMFPWVDLRVPTAEVQVPFLESIQERRHLKTHLPLDALVFSPKAKYIYVGRDGRDCFMSLINHYRSANDNWYAMINDSPDRVGGPIERFDENKHRENILFNDWISKGWNPGETDGYPFWSLFDHVATWWKYRHLPNILFMHYADMLADTEGAIRQIASFLDIPVQEECLPGILEAVSLQGMRKKLLCIPADVAFKEGNASFVFKGVNGRWRGVLSEEQLAKYAAKVAEKLPADCAAWLENGRSSGVDPKA